MSRFAWVVAALVWATSCAPQQRDPLEEGARLMAELREASGGAALDAKAAFHETGRVVVGGETATYETWGDLHSLRWSGTHTAGGKSMTSGFDGQAVWRIGPDGVGQADTSAKALTEARLGAYLTNFAYLRPDRFPARFEYKGRREADGATYDVVTVTPENSTPMDFWLDINTHRLMRLSGMDGETPFLGVVERYETVDGVLTPFAIRQWAGGKAMAQSVTAFEFVDTPEERLARPAR